MNVFAYFFFPLILFLFGCTQDFEKTPIESCEDVSDIQKKLSIVPKKFKKLKDSSAKICVKGGGFEYFTAHDQPFDLRFAEAVDFGRSPRSNFFIDLMGIDEESFKNSESEIKSRLFVARNSTGAPCCFYIKGKDNNVYKCGIFQELSLGDLRKQAAEKLKQNLGSIKFSVIEVGDWASESIKNVDIGALQADPQNIDAVFQVASNFNALETLSPFDNIDKGINNYPNDNTQGPRASISAAPGLVYRQYYYFFNERKNLSSDLWRQRGQDSFKNTDDEGLNLQINLLEGLGVNAQNGYVWDPNTVTNIKEYDLKNDSNSFATHSDYFKVGIHEGIQVVFGLSADENQAHFYNPNQVINQVFAAALNINQPPVCENTSQGQAKLILKWTYEATLKAALVKGKKKVFLTRIGGGVFGNKQEWIDQAIIDAVSELKNSGLDVILNNFKFNDKSISDNIFKRLEKLVADTGGSYIIYEKGKAIQKLCGLATI